jgi:hypothetical protein
MAAAAAAAMPDDILLEILFRLKHAPAILFRCATACKRWRGLVADPAFLRRCWPDQDASSSFVGFFSQELMHTGSLPWFTPMPQSVLGPGRRALSSFMTAAPAGLFDRARPLASRHSLLLVSLDSDRHTILDLAICNLLTGAWHILPLLMFGSVFDESNSNGYAILTGKDCRSSEEMVLPSNPSFFKVVIISFHINDEDDEMKCTLHTFSSDEASWRARTHCFDGIVQLNNYGSSCRAVVHHGTAHWLFCNHGELCLSVLNLNMRTGYISLTKVPFGIEGMYCYNRGHMLLTLAVNGVLSLLWTQKKGTQLEIWEQQVEQPNKDGGSEWVCTRTIELEQLGKRENERRELFILGDKCGRLLVNDSQNMYTVDIQTGMMEAVVDWPRMGFVIPGETVPFEVEWPAIFASRLDNRYI